MCSLDLEVMSSSPGRVKLLVLSIPVLRRSWTKIYIYKITNIAVFVRTVSDLHNNEEPLFDPIHNRTMVQLLLKISCSYHYILILFQALCYYKWEINGNLSHWPTSQNNIIVRFSRDISFCMHIEATRVLFLIKHKALMYHDRHSTPHLEGSIQWDKFK